MTTDGSIRRASVALLVLAWAATAHAQQQSVTFGVGYFAVRGEDARLVDDVIVENLGLFAFDLKQFNGGTVGGEWVVPIGEYFETGVGVGFYQRTVPSVYTDFVDVDGTEILQDFRLRVVPVSATVRLLPTGRRSGVEPYVGGGLALLSWRYAEFGEFVDFDTFDLFRDRFVATGTDVGPLAVGGVRVPVGDHFAVGGELRYQWGSGVVGVENGFLNERVDLGGLTSQVTFSVRF